MFGDVAVNAVKKVLNGEQVDSYIIAESATFDSPEIAAEVLPDRKF
jgi:simple sugar transport system substrate-binding protein